MSFDWQITTFDALTPRQLYAIMAARQAVFSVEQNCAYQDADGVDADCLHLAAWLDFQGAQPQVAAYARLVPAGIKFDAVSIGRVITTAPFRGSQLGKALVGRAIQACHDHFGDSSIKISAQHYLLRFYSGFGFQAQGDVYLEDDIDHIHMVLPGSARPLAAQPIRS